MRMMIGSVKGAGMQPNPAAMGAGAGGQTDGISKDLRNQIENLKKQMQELSANREMPVEVKMKKRQELQKQISELEMQLRQREMEVRREEMQKKKADNGPSMEEMTGGKPQAKKGGKKSAGLSAGSMEAMISADTSMKQADVHGSAARKMDGKAGVLEAEIKLDRGRGGSSNVEAKEEQLADVKAAAQQAEASQMQSLAQAGEKIKEAGEDENQQKVDGTGKEPSAPGEAANIVVKDKDSSEEEKTGKGQGMPEEEENGTFDTEMMGVAFSRGYQPVDVKL